MAKTPKVKKREVSMHSRAARRGAASPPPKDLPAKEAVVEESEYKPWIHNAQNAGISKKKKTKQLSRQQRLRQQKGMEHAERNIDKHEKKVADSKNRGRRVNARRADWDDLNEKFTGKENETGAEKTVQAKEDGAKEMEGVEMPDLALQAAKVAAEEDTEAPIDNNTPPIEEEVDEVT